MFGDKIDEYVKANQGLAKANNELTRAYEACTQEKQPKRWV